VLLGQALPRGSLRLFFLRGVAARRTVMAAGAGAWLPCFGPWKWRDPGVTRMCSQGLS